jgi:hypothetical protein
MPILFTYDTAAIEPARSALECGREAAAFCLRFIRKLCEIQSGKAVAAATALQSRLCLQSEFAIAAAQTSEQGYV